ncbi:MAG: histidine triad nucleotide-binding protein [gamma proteobacterium symbiont of Taylorina sp.]|nr:histidine triad nucleotide-binding protein [gamma proteobacterium symbiont of Taylorina sp.]
MSDCLFCKIIAGDIPADIVYQDDKILVFKDIAPKAEIHLLMIPKVHIESLAEMGLSQNSSQENAHNELIAYMMLKLPELAEAQGLSSGFRTIINTGKEGGQVVFHLHIHLLGGSNLPGF